MAQLASAPAHDALVPPQNLEAEEHVLGAAMLSPAAITACREIVDPSDFYRESHTRIWRAALRLADRGEPVDVITLTDELEQRGELEDAGGRGRLHELAALVPATANAAHYAKIVNETATLRGLIKLGGEISRLGWERPGEASDLVEQARTLAAELGTAIGQAAPLEAETWAQFERSATEDIPTIVDELWPTGGFGFLAAPPKKGKTWVGLDLAIAVATGTPFIARFPVSQAEPVVYLALEGHRAAIRGRIGCMARGHGFDPHRPIANLHIVYKPRGLNLNDPAWIRTIKDLIARVGAKMLVVDVLRRAARFKENSNDEWNDFIARLDPLAEHGCAIALLHHFGKLTEITKDRTPGERMAGAGAMYGAFDVGIFITGSDEGARRLKLEFELRDLANPEPIGAYLAGDPTGKNGGFVFSDTATWTISDAPADHGTEDVTEFLEWLAAQPDRRATTSEIMYAFGISDRTIRRKRPLWEAADVEWTPARGQNEASFTLPEKGGQDRPDTCPPSSVSAQKTPDLQEEPAEPRADGQGRTNNDVRPQETADLQALPRADRADSPMESSTGVTALQLTHQTEETDDIDWGT